MLLMRLTNDYTRCYGGECLKKERCLRCQEIKDEGNGVYMCEMKLFEHDKEDCAFFIELPKNTNNL